MWGDRNAFDATIGRTRGHCNAAGLEDYLLPRITMEDDNDIIRGGGYGLGGIAQA